tara:strand:- start:102 stop:326 length:225 start_codon:yes stop_codon:yes gene_type:complete
MSTSEHKEALSILVQLINIAQQKGAFDLSQSYLAFHAINNLVNDPKLKQVHELMNTTFKSNILSKTVNNLESTD